MAKVVGMIPYNFTNRKEAQQMRLIEKIVSDENLSKAIKKVKANKGTPGIDKMTVFELERYFKEYKDKIVEQILEKRYRPMPVKRVYIPKPNGTKRPLGIPAVVDRVIQQAILITSLPY